MSIDEHYPRGKCGKLCFTSKRVAREANRNARFRLRVYFCDECRRYHVSNGDKKRASF